MALRGLWMGSVASLLALGCVVAETSPTLPSHHSGVTFSTAFEPAQLNRAHNIRLAARFLGNREVPPGEVFSFNESLGPRLAELGFLSAPTLEWGEIVPEVGGGICQVSSTLYNAALIAGMEIVERHAHSSAVRYVGPGRDATVDFPAKDLRLRNPYRFAVRIVMEVEGNRVFATVHPARPIPGGVWQVEVVPAGEPDREQASRVSIREFQVYRLRRELSHGLVTREMVSYDRYVESIR